MEHKWGCAGIIGKAHGLKAAGDVQRAKEEGASEEELFQKLHGGEMEPCWAKGLALVQEPGIADGPALVFGFGDDRHPASGRVSRWVHFFDKSKAEHITQEIGHGCGKG